MGQDDVTNLMKVVSVGALLYGAYLVAVCPCDTLLACEDHMSQFNGAIVIAMGAVVLDRLRKEKS